MANPDIDAGLGQVRGSPHDQIRYAPDCAADEVWEPASGVRTEPGALVHDDIERRINTARASGGGQAGCHTSDHNEALSVQRWHSTIPAPGITARFICDGYI
jgi:hypothetical protein